MDTGVLVTLYGLYLIAAIRTSTHLEEEELVGPAALLDAFGDWPRRIAVVLLLLWSGYMIFLAAAPFAEAL